jgi:Tripartite ATP-independent periplasmic transporter, DctM component
VLLLVVGCFMEALAAMLILIPILAPAAASYGIDPVQFGVMVVLNLIIGTITPPVGVAVASDARDRPFLDPRLSTTDAEEPTLNVGWATRRPER